MKNEVLDKSKNKNMVSMFTDANILKNTDYEALVGCKDFIVDTYLTVPMYRSLPIKLFSVLSNPEFPTPESKYWQCKAEAEVHANEIVRELHDLEDMKLTIEKTQSIITKLTKKIKECENQIKLATAITRDPQLEKLEDFEFDRRKLEISLSRQRFEFAQLQKKLKYRIEEVTEWKKISEGLSSTFDVKNSNYAKMLTVALKEKWIKELTNPKIKETDKKMLQLKIKSVDEMLGSNNSNVNI